MATNFNAGQYQNAFKAKRLQQWTVPQVYKERPSQRLGQTEIISDANGRFLHPSKKASTSELERFSDFRGTWQMRKQDVYKTAPTQKRPSKTQLSEIEQKTMTFSQQ